MRASRRRSASAAAAAKAAWALLQVACLAWVLLRAPRPPLSPVLLALAAVAVPLHRNFEDLNMNGFLLGLATAAARDLDAGHERRAGAWVGAAAALKLFPGLLLLYLAYRRRWRGVLTGAAVAVALSAAPLAPYGATGALHEARAWLAASAAGVWGVRGSNQSLAALVARLHAPAAAVLACDLAAVALALVALRRPTAATRLDRRARRERDRDLGRPDGRIAEPAAGGVGAVHLHLGRRAPPRRPGLPARRAGAGDTGGAGDAGDAGDARL